ncbi:DUF636 domain-containing protein [Coprinopsis cinerea AmutBmut pab1-1]|nr:DUF636 domain-containing protein [Coprinopsis cinerea AmutBmut pab1-1]
MLSTGSGSYDILRFQNPITMAPSDSPTSTSTQAPVVRQGSCLCKGVQYALKGEPLEIRVCHCVNCRKATGSAFMVNSFWFTQNFEITNGQDLIRSFKDKGTASGILINRFFCSVCGSNVYLASTHPKNKFVVVGLGTLDDEHVGWVPDKEWFDEQRRPWIEGIQLRESKSSKGSSLLTLGLPVGGGVEEGGNSEKATSRL